MLKIRTTIHGQLALSFTPALLLLVGTSLGLLLKGLNSNVAFGAATVPVFTIYYTLFLFGQMASRSETLPPWIAMWVANTVLLVGGTFLARRAIWR
jgi:lipopolysaccharide export system permease protein